LWTFAVWTMVDHHEVGQRTTGRPFRTVLPSVVMVGVVFVAVSAGMGRVMGTLAGLAPPGPASRLALAAAILVVASVQALLVYAPIVLRLRNVNAMGALRASVRYASHNFWPTALVIATVLAVHTPLDAMVGASHRVALSFRPETVYYVMLGSVALEMVTAYVLFSSVVGLALPEEGGLR
jgi:hypothetical protein